MKCLSAPFLLMHDPYLLNPLTISQMDVIIISKPEDVLVDLNQTLESDNIQIRLFATWEKAQPCIDTDCPQMVILHCPGQGVNGLNLCRKIRSRYEGLLVMITEESEIPMNVLALEMGVDAIQSVDAGIPLIAAQIKALLRRFAPSAPLSVLTFGQLQVDANRRDVFLAGKPAQLSTVEFNLLWLLVKQAGSVVSREYIHHDLYNSSYNGYDRGIDIYVSRIRQKIGDCPGSPRYLKTVRGVGYQFVAASD